MKTKPTPSLVSRERLSRRKLLAVATVVGAMILAGSLFAASGGKKTFTILHTNDLHSNFLGLGPVADYTPFTLNDDATRGGYARQATLIAQRTQYDTRSTHDLGANRSRYCSQYRKVEPTTDLC